MADVLANEYTEAQSDYYGARLLTRRSFGLLKQPKRAHLILTTRMKDFDGAHFANVLFRKLHNMMLAKCPPWNAQLRPGAIHRVLVALIRHGFDPNHRDPQEGNTLFYHACSCQPLMQAVKRLQEEYVLDFNISFAQPEPTRPPLCRAADHANGTDHTVLLWAFSQMNDNTINFGRSGVDNVLALTAYKLMCAHYLIAEKNAFALFRCVLSHAHNDGSGIDLNCARYTVQRYSSDGKMEYHNVNIRGFIRHIGACGDPADVNKVIDEIDIRVQEIEAFQLSAKKLVHATPLLPELCRVVVAYFLLPVAL
jgi:hypothetical protein